jgi:plastocyanin
MSKSPAFVATVVAVTFVALGLSAIVTMAATMNGGHWGMMGGMMGGRGSNPSNETPVTGVTEVRIQDFAFAPANIIVDGGTVVTWTNYDSVGHTVTSDDGSELDSPLLGKNKTFSHTFDTPGAYAYHCSPHPYMRGLVTVR